MSVQMLPAELMLRILYYVDVPDLLAVSRVGKQTYMHYRVMLTYSHRHAAVFACSRLILCYIDSV